jgi:putative membrane protein
MLEVTLAALHLIALGLGLGAVIQRGTALREIPDVLSARRVFRADTLWGIAALLWIITGVMRYTGTFEKGSAYYNGDSIFQAKMVLLLVIVVLELWPMAKLMRWRKEIRRGGSPAVVLVPGTARIIATISHVQALLVILMVIAATALARGYSL